MKVRTIWIKAELVTDRPDSLGRLLVDTGAVGRPGEVTVVVISDDRGDELMVAEQLFGVPSDLERLGETPA